MLTDQGRERMAQVALIVGCCHSLVHDVAVFCVLGILIGLTITVFEKCVLVIHTASGIALCLKRIVGGFVAECALTA